MRRRAALVPLTLLLAFAAWAWIFGRASEPPEFDLSAFRALSHFRSPAVSRALHFVTELGRTPVALMFVALTWRRSRALAAHLAAAVIGGLLLSEVAKRLIARPRPIEVLPLVDAYGYSFPSGHAVVAAATYTTAAILICRALPHRFYRIAVTAAAILIIGLVALSRIYLGVHYASDTIGGILLGTAWAAIVARHWYDSRNFPPKDPAHEELHDYNTRDGGGHHL